MRGSPVLSPALMHATWQQWCTVQQQAQCTMWGLVPLVSVQQVRTSRCAWLCAHNHAKHRLMGCHASAMLIRDCIGCHLVTLLLVV